MWGKFTTEVDDFPLRLEHVLQCQNVTSRNSDTILCIFSLDLCLPLYLVMDISMIYDYLYICLLCSRFISYELYLSQLSGLLVNNSLRCQRMISPTGFVTHRVIPSLDTAFRHSTTPASLDPTMNSE